MNQTQQAFAASIQQQRLWKKGKETLEQLKIRGTYPMPGDLNQETLKERVEAVLSEHEILRTTAKEENGKVCQIILPRNSELFAIEPDFEAKQLRISASPLAADKATLTLVAKRLLGRSQPSEEGTMQFADYAAWQEELINSAKGTEAETYWREKSVMVSPLLLRFKQNKGAYVLGQESRTFQVQGSFTSGERLALWGILAGRLCGSNQISVSTSVNRRKFPELKNAMGPYSAWLPVTIEIENGYSLPSLAQKINAEREKNHVFSEYYETSENLECRIGYEEAEERADGLTAPFDICLSLQEQQGRLIGTIYYNKGLYDQADAKLILDRYEHLLFQAGKNPNGDIDDYSLVGPEEEKLLSSFNRQEQPSKPGCIHYQFEAQARKTPLRIAVTCGSVSYTYKELNEKANLLAHALLGEGLKTETPVGICLGRAVETVVSILAVLKAGCAYVPLDPTYPVERLEHMISEAAIPIVLTNKARGSHLPKESRLMYVEEVFSGTGKTENPPRLLGGEELAYIIFTSGSTGQPKGVLIQHNTLVNSTQARIEYYKQPIGSFLMVSSFSFDSSVAGIFWTLTSGATLVLPTDDNHNDPFALKRLIKDESVTHMLALPSLYSAILESEASDLRTLRTVIVAGEACTTNLVQKHFGKLPQCGLFNEYGPTEATVWATVEQCLPGKPVTIGRPIPNAQAYVLDAELRHTPLGLPGELYIGGAGIARGYLNRKELEAEKFIPDPFNPAPGRRLYKTGDLVRYTIGGNLEFLGRADKQVKIRGHRIELEEIESALCSITGVNEAVALPQRNEEGVHVDLIAYILGELSGDQCRAAAAKILPEYMRPSRVIVLQQFPRTANGKVDRNALEALEPQTPSETAAGVLPRSPVEERLFEIWKDVLRRDGFGIEDSFFNLGGHSLLAMQMMGRIKEEFSIELPLKTIFEKTTITGISESILELLLQEEAELEMEALKS